LSSFSFCRGWDGEAAGAATGVEKKNCSVEEDNRDRAFSSSNDLQKLSAWVMGGVATWRAPSSAEDEDKRRLGAGDDAAAWHDEDQAGDAAAWRKLSGSAGLKLLLSAGLVLA
jgi:hypothetical protein